MRACFHGARPLRQHWGAPLSRGSQHHPWSLHVRCPTCDFIIRATHSGFRSTSSAVALQNLRSGLLYDSAKCSGQGKAIECAQHHPRTRGTGVTKGSLGAVGRRLAQLWKLKASNQQLSGDSWTSGTQAVLTLASAELAIRSPTPMSRTLACGGVAEYGNPGFFGQTRRALSRPSSRLSSPCQHFSGFGPWFSVSCERGVRPPVDRRLMLDVQETQNRHQAQPVSMTWKWTPLTVLQGQRRRPSRRASMPNQHAKTVVRAWGRRRFACCGRMRTNRRHEHRRTGSTRCSMQASVFLDRFR